MSHHHPACDFFIQDLIAVKPGQYRDGEVCIDRNPAHTSVCAHEVSVLAPSPVPILKTYNWFRKVREFGQGKVAGPGYDLQNQNLIFFFRFLTRNPLMLSVFLSTVWGSVSKWLASTLLVPSAFHAGYQFQSTCLQWRIRKRKCSASLSSGGGRHHLRNVKDGRSVSIVLRCPGVQRWQSLRDSFSVLCLD